jgi:hypothetical protein
VPRDEVADRRAAALVRHVRDIDVRHVLEHPRDVIRGSHPAGRVVELFPAWPWRARSGPDGIRRTPGFTVTISGTVTNSETGSKSLSVLNGSFSNRLTLTDVASDASSSV